MATSFFGGAFFGGEFFNSGGSPTPTPATRAQSGVRRRGRWALKYYDKLYYFDDLKALQAFANQPPPEAVRQDLPKRKARPRIVVPVETVAEAREAGYEGLQKLADRLDYDALKRIEAKAFKDDVEDMSDFLEFINSGALDG